MRQITKKEFLALRKKHNVYYPPEMILDIFDDDDVLPEYMIDLMTQPPSPPQEIIWYVPEEILQGIEEYMKRQIDENKTANHGKSLCRRNVRNRHFNIIRR